MSSQIAQLRDALAVDLNAETNSWVEPFTAVARWRARWSSTELAELRVAVTPGPVEYESISRSADKMLVSTDVVFAKAVNPDDNASVDPIAETVEQVAAAYRNALLEVGDKEARCTKREFVNPGESAVVERLLNDRTAVFALRMTWLVQVP